MRISEILGTKNIFEVLKANDKPQKAITPIKPKGPNSKTIKPIRPASPPTPAKACIQSKKENVDRAKEDLKRTRTIQKWNNK